jgi:hypothetical protein
VNRPGQLNDQARWPIRPRRLLDLTSTKRFRAPGAEIVVDLFPRQHEQKTFTHRHGTATLLAVEGGSAEIFELAH